MKIEHKVFPGEVLSFDDKTLTLEHFISTETQDSGGDVMIAEGMEQRGSVVVLFQHGLDPKFGNEPIAKCLGVRVGANKQGKKGLIAKTQYYDGSKLDPPDNTGHRLYEKDKAGIMPNWSIGYEVVSSDPISGGRKVSKWRLHEYSKVAIGMNAEAVSDFGSKMLSGMKFCVVVEGDAGAAGADAQDKPQKDDVAASTKSEDTVAVSTESKGSLTSIRALQRGLNVIHKGMVSDLKAVAEAEEYSSVSAEKNAKAAVAEFTSAAAPFVEKYIEHLAKMEAEAEVPGDDEEDESELDEKAIADVPHKAAYKALKIAYKEMVEEVRACKGKADLAGKSADESGRILGEHEKAALPHATKYVEAWNAYRSRSAKFILDAETKSLTDKTSYAIARQSLCIIFDAICWEACERAYDDANGDSGVIADEILAEAHALMQPYLKWIIDDVRKRRAEAVAQNMSVAEIKDCIAPFIKVFVNHNHQPESTSTDPAGDVKSTAFQVEKYVEPQALKFGVSGPAPAPSFGVKTEPQKETAPGVLMVKATREEVAAIAADIRANLDASLSGAINKAKGKV